MLQRIVFAFLFLLALCLSGCTSASYDVPGVVTNISDKIILTKSEEESSLSNRFKGTYWENRDSLMALMLISEDGDEKLRLCQIDEEELNIMSTENLVHACYAFPLAYDVFLNNDEMYATNFYIDHFNGLTELLTREDAISKMIQLYSSLESGRSGPQLREAYIERVLSSTRFRNKMTPEETSEILRIAENKLESNRSQADLIRQNRKETLISLLRNHPEPRPDEPGVGLQWPDYTQTTAQTPFGKTVICSVPETDMNQQERDSLANIVLTTYSNVQILDQATFYYNCHAYAWLNSTSVWLDSTYLHLFYTDDMYVTCTEEPYSIIHYYEGDHSALHYNGSLTYYDSKWGAWPRVKHAPANVPASYQPSYRRYYHKRSFAMTGPDTYQVGVEYTYSVTPSLSFASYVWSIDQSSNKYQITSINNNVLKVKFLVGNTFFNVNCDVCNSTGSWVAKHLEYETYYTP